ncbi:ribosomal protein S18 acetylase RimI-like enzyme [Spirosoma lacussanchae]|uniref:GNAT family N-acetyltransferase n=1 Tax=Spirosoma lacussanchae TaxID=1884249 RepID=UPI001109ECE5|nr:GNAT family N-acetyltransferase [Spirosoma lacussanchae]
MFIRPATAADAALLADLSAVTMCEAFGPPHNPAPVVDAYIQSALTPETLATELNDKRSVFFIADQDGSAVGFAKLRRHAPPRRMPLPYRSRGQAVEIQRIYLLNSQIGQGQGRLLMNYCLDWARQQGYKAVWLGVWERNERALGFYQRMGFERFGFHYFQFGPERQRDYWLVKIIDA